MGFRIEVVLGPDGAPIEAVAVKDLLEIFDRILAGLFHVESAEFQPRRVDQHVFTGRLRGARHRDPPHEIIAARHKSDGHAALIRARVHLDCGVAPGTIEALDGSADFREAQGLPQPDRDDLEQILPRVGLKSGLEVDGPHRTPFPVLRGRPGCKPEKRKQ